MTERLDERIGFIGLLLNGLSTSYIGDANGSLLLVGCGVTLSMEQQLMHQLKESKMPSGYKG